MVAFNLRIFWFVIASSILLSGCQNLANQQSTVLQNFVDQQRSIFINRDQRNFVLMNSYGLNSNHEIKADITNWKIVNVKTDIGGYFKFYLPQQSTNNQEKILINYGKNVTTSLNDSVQQVLNVEKRLPCATFTYKVLSHNSNSASLMTQLAGCQQGPSSLITIRKIFNADDGQYSITYSAIPTGISTSRLNDMQHVVVASHL